MEKIWLHFVRGYLRVGLFFYFKEIRVLNANRIPKNKPVLFLANHQNALLDALLIAVYNGRFSYFLTRAAVFKKSFVSAILKSLRMLPVYRIRDGWSNLSNNNSIFKRCTELLSRGEAVVIFPEGSHNLARRVRPLSKGFTRIVFDTLEQHPNLDLQLVPIGLNFVKAESFPDSTAIYVGDAISAKHYISDDRNKSVIALKSDVHNALSELTTHIPVEHYDSTLKTLKAINVDFLKPHEVNKCINSGFKTCYNISKPRYKSLKLVLKWLLIVNLWLPYLLWKKIVQPKIDEIEFMSTFRFAVAITLVPLYVLIVLLMICFFIGAHIGFVYLASILILVLLYIKL